MSFSIFALYMLCFSEFILPVFYLWLFIRLYFYFLPHMEAGYQNDVLFAAASVN